MEYRSPSLTDAGSVAGLTQASTVGDTTDDAFPAGTPQEDLTFS